MPLKVKRKARNQLPDTVVVLPSGRHRIHKQVGASGVGGLGDGYADFRGVTASLCATRIRDTTF